MIKSILKDHKQEIDALLLSYFSEKKAEYANVDPSLVDIIQLIEQQTLRGGKRIRPLFVRLAYDLLSEKQTNIEKIAPACISVELIHQFLLIHDDIADRDEKRYGAPSLHEMYSGILKKKFNKDLRHYSYALAMGAGDMVYALALESLYSSDFPSDSVLRAGKIISRYLTQTVAGWTQQFYTLFSNIENVSEEDYLRSTALVTAYYTVEGPLLVGASLAEVDSYNDILSRYAYHVGLAFQIQDDILGMFGKTSKTGKPVGNDFREGKKTILILKAYEKADKKERDFLSANIGKALTNQQLSKVQKIIEDSKALYYTKSLGKHHAQLGVKELDKLPDSVNHKAKSVLKGIAQFLVERDY